MQFEQVAKACKWDPQAKLIHVNTHLHGEALAFYRSCSKSQKADYSQLLKELTQRLTLVRISSVQTSLFHKRKQGKQESVDSYVQDLKSTFHKVTHQPVKVMLLKTWDGQYSHSSLSLDSFLLSSQIGRYYGSFDEVFIKARFKETKLCDLNPKNSTRKTSLSHRVSFIFKVTT